MNYMNKKIVSLVILVAVVVGGLAFYAGTKYKRGNTAGGLQARNSMGGTFNRSGRTPGMGGGFTGGEVISKDDKSITVKGRDGSSKVVLFTANTPVMKMVAGTNTDIAVGQDITVTGTTNPDGSVSADSIQLRPAQETPKAN